jgi:hypothetical protein
VVERPDPATCFAAGLSNPFGPELGNGEVYQILTKNVLQK